MPGPEIIVRSLTAARVSGRFGNEWQYHSRSDSHSKICCWSVMFDFLLASDLLRAHIRSGKAVFGINHTMYDFQTNRKKDLDLVICTPAGKTRIHDRDFVQLGVDYGIVLEQEEKRALDDLPRLVVRDVGTVLIALEAKACMTAHIKALPRLYDELSASEQVIHGDSKHSIANALVLVNTSDSFISPTVDQNKKPNVFDNPSITEHRQPRDANRVIEKIAELPRRSSEGQRGFDGIGIVLCNAPNDGSAITLVDPSEGGFQVPHVLTYPFMVDRVVRDYAARFRDL